MRSRDSGTTHADSRFCQFDRQPLVEIHKETVSQTGRLTGRHLAGIEADRNKHTDTGEQLHEVGGITGRPVSTKLRAFLIHHEYRISTAVYIKLA